MHSMAETFRAVIKKVSKITRWNSTYQNAGISQSTKNGSFFRLPLRPNLASAFLMGARMENRFRRSDPFGICFFFQDVDAAALQFVVLLRDGFFATYPPPFILEVRFIRSLAFLTFDGAVGFAIGAAIILCAIFLALRRRRSAVK